MRTIKRRNDYHHIVFDTVHRSTFTISQFSFHSLLLQRRSEKQMAPRIRKKSVSFEQTKRKIKVNVPEHFLHSEYYELALAQIEQLKQKRAENRAILCELELGVQQLLSMFRNSK